ncbi:MULTISPECIES: phosphohistidine phosphatase SixA [unclassified Coleofasciculus]|uniref:phosphohistidine phosphatase SixA n=1 Tax=unclassified Coleofasciculus TaxID=2692782 RepID=UPI00187E8B68|nr:MULTISPECIES: phosphohistidine phosphatase SixA [unclassified Coleofasciculus]MBE9127614.1 phosphohistidine phosphatase SixA [Coleofasciculus sp. LEGE 07081]MBE9149661.1 phosphohistidine phosphatase SixA [Coleofasciculus sp. LEGE 07092]
MELYLIRHGIAAEGEDYANDEERPLTGKGRQKTTKVAKQLRDRRLHFDRILTSPLVRARETAIILQEVGLGSEVEEFPALAPDGDIYGWVHWLEVRRQNATGEGCVALVGHQPNLGNWAETLVWGEAKEKLVLKKAGVIGVKVPASGNPVGQSDLFLLAAPKWLL